MNVLILGSYAREHALAWKIAQSPLVTRVFVAPGNAGTAHIATNVALDVEDHPAVIDFCRGSDIGLVVPGPDALLAAGIVDALTTAGITTFGPTRAAAEVEWSKSYAKTLMSDAGIPTARSKTFSDYEKAVEYVRAHPLPVVVKVDGLASGKGVVVAKTRAEALEALSQMMRPGVFGELSVQVVIEEFLEGIEFSVHALCARNEAILFPPSQDHKRAYDGDVGPNTGGMGVVAPVSFVSAEVMEEVRTRIVQPMLLELARRGRPYTGLLYPGLMLTADGPKVIEFNARFGDPETEVYMRLLESDIVPALLSVARNEIPTPLRWRPRFTACVVMASGGYPGKYEIEKTITGIDGAESQGAVVFHYATKEKQHSVVTNGGRILGVTGVGDTLSAALEQSYAGVKGISFEGAQYRTDIGAKAAQ